VQAVRRASQFAVKKTHATWTKTENHTARHSPTQNSTWDLVPLVEVVVKRNACLPCCSAVFISRPGGFKHLSFPRRLTILSRRDPPEHCQVVIGVFFVTLHPTSWKPGPVIPKVNAWTRMLTTTAYFA
jgi:hypothetical protein